MGHFSKRTFSGLVGVALIAAACTGDGESTATPDDGVGRSIGGSAETVTTTTTAPVETTTTTTVLAPSTLAFSSSDDIGRLFSIGQDITATTSAGGEPDAAVVSAGTIVQASSFRDTDGTIWVRIESTALDGPTLGWVPAAALDPTLESVFYQDSNISREFRQVSGSVPDDQLGVFASPGAGAPLSFLQEDAIALHGGVTGLSPSGDLWLDTIDPNTGDRTGWVQARFFSRVGGEIRDGDGNDVDRSPEDDVSYGQPLSGAITATACNAVQVTFTSPSPNSGIGMTFGTSSPVGRERNNGSHDWSGTPAFSTAGQDIIVTIPLDSAQTWFFAPLDADEQASFSSVDGDGMAIANGVVEIAAPSSSCRFVPDVDPDAEVYNPLIVDDSNDDTAGDATAGDDEGPENGDEEAPEAEEESEVEDAPEASDEGAEANAEETVDE